MNRKQYLEVVINSYMVWIEVLIMLYDGKKLSDPLGHFLEQLLNLLVIKGILSKLNQAK